MIQFLSRNPEAETFRQPLTRLARRILSDSGRSEAELSILVTDDREIRSLNSDYRSRDMPTDVLSFSQQEGEGPGTGHELLGDVVISLETALRQADEAGHPALKEMKRLLVHGIGHLLGYDHEGGAEEAALMREWEEKYLEGR